jgi:hypothetical protein
MRSARFDKTSIEMGDGEPLWATADGTTPAASAIVASAGIQTDRR